MIGNESICRIIFPHLLLYGESEKELWNHDVALIEYVDEAIVGYILHIDRTTRSAIARATEIARQPVGLDVRGEMERRTGIKSGTVCFSNCSRSCLNDGR